MPTFNKSRGFKLKSGNKANAAFKMMGSSPIQQQADGTLVQAAQNAAMANVPKDNSAQYQKAADAANTASKAQTEALTSIMKEATGMIIGATKAIKKGTAKRKARKADVGFQDAKQQVKDTKTKFKKDKKAGGTDKKELREQKRADLKTQKANRKVERKRVNKEAGEEFEKTWEKEGRSNVSDARKLTGADGSAADKDRDYKNEYDQKKYKDKLKNYGEEKANKKTLKKLQKQLDDLGL
jgi:hypothetical protein